MAPTGIDPFEIRSVSHLGPFADYLELVGDTDIEALWKKCAEAKAAWMAACPVPELADWFYGRFHDGEILSFSLEPGRLLLGMEELHERSRVQIVFHGVRRVSSREVEGNGKLIPGEMPRVGDEPLKDAYFPHCPRLVWILGWWPRGRQGGYHLLFVEADRVEVQPLSRPQPAR